MKSLRDYPEQVMHTFRNTRLSDVVLYIVSVVQSLLRR